MTIHQPPRAFMHDRYHRQQSLAPPHRVQDLAPTIVGVGAVGRQVTLQLAALGVRRMQIMDPDVVDETNVATQGYRFSDLNRSKVAATREAVLDFDPTISFTVLAERFRPVMETGNVVFCCVDSIRSRRAIWRSIRRRDCLWIDGRLLGEVIRVLSVSESIDQEYYETTLFEPRLAQQGTCGAHSTLYSASIAAGLMVHQLARWLRETPLDRDVVFDLAAGDLILDDAQMAVEPNP